MPVYWLRENELNFPHPQQASSDGLLAVGGDLSVKRLLLAYSWGIFPWFTHGDPILWWHPNPRFVLFPDQLRVSKSMRPYFNQQKYRTSYNQAFSEVIRSCCSVARRGQESTWITEEMIEAYEKLHAAGFAHSVEVWQEDQLVGGLYGVAIGRVFFGESMFAKASNASKFGFITLVRDLQRWGFQLIDCQQETRHLESLGAMSISRQQFLDILEKNQVEAGTKKYWQSE